MSKHAPGPWHVIEYANGRAFGVGVQVQTKGNMLVTHNICRLSDMATPQAEANAHLIAAAPQMLEALEAAISALEDASCLGFNLTEQIKKVDAAIRAANGEV